MTNIWADYIVMHKVSCLAMARGLGYHHGVTLLLHFFTEREMKWIGHSLSFRKTYHFGIHLDIHEGPTLAGMCQNLKLEHSIMESRGGIQ